jgi:ABC-type bacteriocin/lantibiotic exporter with double-glycine peptidase domain
MPPPGRSLGLTHVPQRSEADCLAACAAMILGAAGRTPSYARLLRLLHVQEYGTAFFRLAALAKLGVSVHFGTGVWDEVLGWIEAGVPVVLAVRTEYLGHWQVATAHAVVLVAVDAEIALMHDPALATGPHALPAGELIQAWDEAGGLAACLVESVAA